MPQELPKHGESSRDDRTTASIVAVRAQAPQGSASSIDAGETIGPYRLLDVIGEGGFGVVYLAERREPMVQRVALKIIKPGMDSQAVIARFEQERQALAVMDHPNVARVFDGGVTPAGRPYFVMEHVQGEPITTFADRRRLTIKQRLELFIPVCEAVQHAHHKGLIHRDIKPSNVLIAEIEGKPVPKVIDFGVAKAIATQGWTNTAHTQSGMVIGTPEYMSPEQIAGEVDVDTRADVYSLGVLLYELLTGELPFDSRELRKAALVEIARIIREVTPPKPSTRLAQMGGDRTKTVAQARSTSSDRLASELRRELDWIPLMALRKERDRRYQSPQALADDVRRYLDGRALRAAPDSTAYLARKFIRRNKVQVAATAAVFVALSAGLAVALWQRSEAIAARDAEGQQRARADERADAAIKAEAAATAARDAEKERADQLKKVSDFQSDMLGQIDIAAAGEGLMTDVQERFVAALDKSGVPEDQRIAQTSAFGDLLARVNATDTAAAMIDRTILKPAIKTIDQRFGDDPATDASLRQALADLYRAIGLYTASMPLHESALTVRRRLLGNDHADTLASVNNMGVLLSLQGRLSEAEPFYREALETHRRVLGEEHPDTIVSISNLGVLLGDQGRLEEAERYVGEALERSRRVLGSDHPSTLDYLNAMGFVLWKQGKLSEAEPYYIEALEARRRVLGEDDPETIQSIINVGVLLQNQNKKDHAERYQREALEKCRRVLGAQHPSTLISLSNLGSLLRDRGLLAEAEPFSREALDGRRVVLGDKHPETLISINNMGRLLLDQGKPDQAEPLCREAFSKSVTVNGPHHPTTLAIASNLARVLQMQGKYQETIDLITPIEPHARTELTGARQRVFAGLLTTLARARVGLGRGIERFTLAESNLVEAYPILLRFRGSSHAETVECIQAFIDLYAARHAAEPGNGHDAKAAEWKAKLEAAQAHEPAGDDAVKPAPTTDR